MHINIYLSFPLMLFLVYSYSINNYRRITLSQKRAKSAKNEKIYITCGECDRVKYWLYSSTSSNHNMVINIAS
jgi:hypothetical protein